MYRTCLAADCIWRQRLGFAVWSADLDEWGSGLFIPGREAAAWFGGRLPSRRKLTVGHDRRCNDVRRCRRRGAGRPAHLAVHVQPQRPRSSRRRRCPARDRRRRSTRPHNVGRLRKKGPGHRSDHDGAMEPPPTLETGERPPAQPCPGRTTQRRPVPHFEQVDHGPTRPRKADRINDAPTARCRRAWYYKNCEAAVKGRRGPVNARRTARLPRNELDPDKDGVACDKKVVTHSVAADALR